MIIWLSSFSVHCSIKRCWQRSWNDESWDQHGRGPRCRDWGNSDVSLGSGSPCHHRPKARGLPRLGATGYWSCDHRFPSVGDPGNWQQHESGEISGTRGAGRQFHESVGLFCRTDFGGNTSWSRLQTKFENQIKGRRGIVRFLRDEFPVFSYVVTLS